MRYSFWGVNVVTDGRQRVTLVKMVIVYEDCKSTLWWLIFSHVNSYPRHITPLLLDALSDTPVVVVNGAQQSGITDHILSMDT